MSAPPPAAGSPPALLWRRADQVAIALLVGGALVVMAVAVSSQGYFGGRLIDLEQTAAPPVSFQLDINAADWPELMLLPNVGETMARRIVEIRRQSGPFSGPEDLRRRVPGIGPKTLDGIKPFLLPPAPSPAAAP